MDVFLEDPTNNVSSSLLSRLAVAQPLQASTVEDLIAECRELCRHQTRYVAVRRQQVRRIGEHAIRDVLDDHGLSVNCLGFAGGFTGALGLSYEMALSDVRRALDMAMDLAADSVVIVPGDRGLHTYRHAERIIRDGLVRCEELATSCGTKLLLPNDTVLAGTRDCFRPKLSLLDWLKQMKVSSIRPMIVVRGQAGAWRLPRGWRLSLADGGCIRICHRCSSYSQNSQLLKGIINFLNRGETGSPCEDLRV